jgi:hypothetical protein
MFAAELHRLEGELLLQRSTSDADVTERKFRHALGLARKRGAVLAPSYGSCRRSVVLFATLTNS